jgi:hypothetical protein
MRDCLVISKRYLKEIVTARKSSLIGRNLGGVLNSVNVFAFMLLGAFTRS